MENAGRGIVVILIEMVIKWGPFCGALQKGGFCRSGSGSIWENQGRDGGSAFANWHLVLGRDCGRE